MAETVYVIIVTYNGVAYLKKHKRLLASLTEQLIIVDNCSSDDSVRMLQEDFQSNQIIFNKDNYGFGYAMNQGISKAKNMGAQHVLLLNQDASISIENIGELAKLQAENPSFGILSPNQYSDGEDINLTFDRELSKYRIDERDNPNGITRIDFINGATWMLSRDCINDVGGFDPSFFMYFEDADYAERVKAQGYKIGVCQEVKSYHANKNPREFDNQQIQKNYINKWRFEAFWEKNGRTINTYLLEILKRLTSAIIYLVSLKTTYSAQNYWKFKALVLNLHWVLLRKKKILSKGTHFLHC